MTVDAPRLKPVDIGKPRMRGYLHMYAFFVAVVCGVVLCSLAATRPGLAPVVSCVIYSVTVCGLFGVSALYHRRMWGERGFQVMRRLDHSMIFLFIAGTYTPFCVLLLTRRSATTLLAVVWTGAVLGVVMKMIRPHGHRWLWAPLYIALGWVAVVVLPDIGRTGVATLVLLVVGGAAYSVGAVFYALRRPNPWPTVFGHHEFFHACTLVAAVSHHIAIYLAVFR